MEKRLEITITHKFNDVEEVEDLFYKNRIALHWKDVRSGKNKDPREVNAWKKQQKLFDKMGKEGAAVIAAYKQATPQKPSLRLVGWIKEGSKPKDDDLYWLELSKFQKVDSSIGFFGNLAPRQCAIQTCDKRANGMLAQFILGEDISRKVGLLHHRDLELLVTNYLMSNISGSLCKAVWRGGQAHEAIDHAGIMQDGKMLLAQTTRTTDREKIKEKVDALRKAAIRYPDAALYFFGYPECKSDDLENIEYISIKDIFSEMDNTGAGHWLIDQMFPKAQPI